MNKAKDIEAALLLMADGRQARAMLRFFKTGPGDYGEGDRFAGLRNPQVRTVVKNVWRTTALEDAVALVRSPLHEVRLCGLLIMVEQYLKAAKEGDSDQMSRLFGAYTSLYRHINNWDLVDLTATKLVGTHEHFHPELRLMDEWIASGHTLWQRRIAMVSTWMLTRKCRPETCFNRAAQLLDNPHDLLHKAAGWMLRETWNCGYRDGLRAFLEAHVDRMPSVMLSYACEKMTSDERRSWQTRRRQARTCMETTNVFDDHVETDHIHPGP